MKKNYNNTYSGKFSLKDYRVLLERFLSNNYKFTSYENVIPSQKHIIMRHDIDFIPEEALELAKIEESYKIKAHYFFLVNTEFYNINSYKVKNIIYKLENLGHEIGLHYDPRLSSNYTMDLKKEINNLEKITKKKVKTISFHRPIKKLLNDKKKYGKALHTYMPKFFSEIGYVSDSRGAWHYGTPFENNFFLKEMALQVLIHPEWWVFKNSISETKKLEKILIKMQKNLSQQLKNNISSNFILKNYCN